MLHYRKQFITQISAGRVRFGADARYALADEIAALGCQRALILSTASQSSVAEDIIRLCGAAAAGRFSGAVMHTPVEISERATDYAKKINADILVAVGGGSTIGLSKAIALRTGLPQIVLPVTYAGSEATAILGQTENGIKSTLTSPLVKPEVIIYDINLAATLPLKVAIPSAMNALAHAAEGLYARDNSPLSSLMAVEGLRAFRKALPRVVEDPKDPDARGEALYGAWLCGSVLGQVGMALHHKLCHTLGGSFNLPHAETHSVILPHAIHYNAAAVPEMLTPVSEIFANASPGIALYDFAKKMAAPLALRDLGLQASDLDRAVEIALAKPYWNPRPVERKPLREMLQAAWLGERPGG